MRALIVALLLAACSPAFALRVYDIGLWTQPGWYQGGYLPPVQLGHVSLTVLAPEPHGQTLWSDSFEFFGEMMGTTFDSRGDAIFFDAAAYFYPDGVTFGGLVFWGKPSPATDPDLIIYATINADSWFDFRRDTANGMGLFAHGNVTTREVQDGTTAAPVAAVVPPPIPEPSTYALLLIGLAGLLVTGRRSARRAPCTLRSSASRTRP
jgi:hypothetical protein